MQLRFLAAWQTESASWIQQRSFCCCRISNSQNNNAIGRQVRCLLLVFRPVFGPESRARGDVAVLSECGLSASRRHHLFYFRRCKKSLCLKISLLFGEHWSSNWWYMIKCNIQIWGLPLLSEVKCVTACSRRVAVLQRCLTYKASPPEVIQHVSLRPHHHDFTNFTSQWKLWCNNNNNLELYHNRNISSWP